jgi:hypothetical protein
VSYLAFLWATSMCREAMYKRPLSQETLYFHILTLQEVRKATRRPTKDYTDGFVCALSACTCVAVSLLYGSILLVVCAHNEDRASSDTGML